MKRNKKNKRKNNKREVQLKNLEVLINFGMFLISLFTFIVLILGIG